ncbi:DUF2357 domain-containing protein [Paenibacillus kandeliae]|uniref:DUF2357 domain-containing protein n=1 Tax=Paenibacillus kandeliae TaxID=3231269 RepID=UPI00345AC235
MMNPEQTVRLLEVGTSIGNLYIEGRPYHPAVETLELHREQGKWIDAHLKCVSLSSDVQVHYVYVFSPLEGRLVEWNAHTPVWPCFYEQQNYEFVYEKADGIKQRVHFYHANRYLREAVSEKGSRLLSGLLNFRNEVGFSELELRAGGERLLSLELEVFPSKIDYRDDYAMLLQDVNRQVYNLSFDFLKRTYQSVSLRHSERQSLTEFFSIISHLFEQMERAMERIGRQPHHRMEKELEMRKAALAKRPGRRNSDYLAKHPQYLENVNAGRIVKDDRAAQDGRRVEGGRDLQDHRGIRSSHPITPARGTIQIGSEAYRPTRLLDTVKHLSYDTAENRLLRWMLERIMGKLVQLRDQYVQLSKPGNFRSRSYDEHFAMQVNQMIRRMEQMLGAEWLQTLTPMRSMSISLVMQMAPGYREMYRYYLTLLKGLSIQSDVLRLSMKEISELYEYWCFLKLNELMANKYQLVQQDVIRLNHAGLFVTLDTGKQSRMQYRHPRTGETFVLYYNRSSQQRWSPTLAQRPDNVLSLRKWDAGLEKEYNFIFDAKYKLDVAEQGSEYHRRYGLPGPQEDDINTMHRYRDAIVHLAEEQSAEEHRLRYERSMYGAYVLFPYGNEQQYTQHHFYKSVRKINVGALPFLPNATSLVEQFLDELIADSPEQAYERATVPQRTDEYYTDKMQQRQRNMLVGSVRGQEQVELALEHRFYHVPLRNLGDAQQVTSVEYVAMYQSKRVFGAEQAGIHYYGRVTGWQIMPRGQIAELPRNERRDGQLYVKFTVETWQQLERAIVPGGQGIYTLLYTSKYMFDRAQELAELRLNDEQQLREWREKRRQGRVKVTLDQHYVDQAEQVLDITVQPSTEQK